MNTNLTPYDSGERAEPSTWTPSNSHLYSLPAGDRARILTNHRDDFGKVDFDTPEGQTIATVWATPTGDSWTLHIAEHGAPLALAVETDQLRALLDQAEAAVDDVERSTRPTPWMPSSRPATAQPTRSGRCSRHSDPLRAEA
jgi:hypothetical protein